MHANEGEIAVYLLRILFGYRTPLQGSGSIKQTYLGTAFFHMSFPDLSLSSLMVFFSLKIEMATFLPPRSDSKQ